MVSGGKGSVMSSRGYCDEISSFKFQKCLNATSHMLNELSPVREKMEREREGGARR